ncbi:hypothetical protein N7467_001072 [Penicillium canescens]|nr:hypothetical protein N7467_001072 [Penicillium canescens]
MARVPRRTRHKSRGNATDTTPLLESAHEKRSLQRNKQEPVSGSATIRPLDDQAQTTLPLRLLHDCVRSEAWWTPFKALSSQEEGPKRNEQQKKPTAGERQLDWMRRLRPKPHRQCALGRAS